MQIFLQDRVQGVELATVNQCQMYLKVVFLSDICNGEVTKIEQSYWDGQPAHSTSKYLWPCTSLPTQQDWNLWR